MLSTGILASALQGEAAQKLTLESFGITKSSVTGTVVGYAIGTIVAAAITLAVWWLFSIALAKLAKENGEKKEWYAYLPLLRLYTLGKLTKGSEKMKKLFACLIPTLAVLEYVMTVILSAVFVRGMFELIFVAEGMEGGSIDVGALLMYPLTAGLITVIIAAIVTVAYRVAYALSYFGAVSRMGNTTAIVFTVINLICPPVGSVLFYVAARKEPKAAVAAVPAPEADETEV